MSHVEDDDSGFYSFEVFEPITTRIAGILDEYPDGTQLARELLQNSEDARSTRQWYLLDHRNHPKDKLFRVGLEDYMGPALLAGNDSLFEKQDFQSLMHLAASGKRDDNRKIGQMGIGFNSVYHMTDCPSFLSHDQLVILEPHAKIFNGDASGLRGGARGDFVTNGRGLERFPDQIKPFAALDNDLDLSKPYNGTIFRFPLRTEAQAKTSELSKAACSIEKARDMLMKLKKEALKCLLFLKHVERITIFERKESDVEPTLLFDIDIVNVEEVRAARSKCMNDLKKHLDLASETPNDGKTLDYSIRPRFRLTDGNGTETFETWQVTSMIGNALEAHRQMTDRCDIAKTGHRLIPWVGIAAPLDSKTKIEHPGLFCFLPIGVNIPFPVHINGHFAVKHSRSEIWNDQDSDFPREGAAGIKSHWNRYMIRELVPVAYARFLEDIGTEHGTDYSLWPKPPATRMGMGALWHDMLILVLLQVIKENLRVFLVGPATNKKAVSYTACQIACSDLNLSKLLLALLHKVIDLAVNLPEHVLTGLNTLIRDDKQPDRRLNPDVVRKKLLENSDWFAEEASLEAKNETLKYCIRDGNIQDLEGLPLLLMAAGTWVTFSKDLGVKRFLITDDLYGVLSYSNSDVIDISVKEYTLETLQKKRNEKFDIFFKTEVPPSVFVQKIRQSFTTHYYSQPNNQTTGVVFPSIDWLTKFWGLSYLTQHVGILSQLNGLHLLRVASGKLAPLDSTSPVLVSDGQDSTRVPILEKTLAVLDGQLDYRVLAPKPIVPYSIASDYLVEITDVSAVLKLLNSSTKLTALNQVHRKTLSQYIQRYLTTDVRLQSDQLATLRKLPIFRGYSNNDLDSINNAIYKHGPTPYVCSGFSWKRLPWQPSTVTLFPQSQDLEVDLTKVLTYFLRLSILDESQYWSRLLPEILKSNEIECNKIVLEFSKKVLAYPQLLPILKDIAFVRVRGPGQGGPSRRIEPRFVVSSALQHLYLHDELVFPEKTFAESSVLTMLQKLGMTSEFTADLALERIKTISDRREEGAAVVDIATALFSKMQSYCTESNPTDNLAAVMVSSKWIPASLGSPNLTLYRPQECRPLKDRALLGNTMPMLEIDFGSVRMEKIFGWDKAPPLEKVLEHLLQLVKPMSESVNTGSPNEAVFRKIYLDFLKRINDPKALAQVKNTVQSQNWILVNRRLYPTNRVAFNVPSFLEPRYVPVQENDLAPLFRAVGVPESLEENDLQGLIQELAEQNRSGENGPLTTLSEEDSMLAARILEHITVSGTDSKGLGDLHGLLVLTRDSKLFPIDRVIFNDWNAGQEIDHLLKDEDGTDYAFASSKISLAVAQKLRLTMLSTHYWRVTMDPEMRVWQQDEDIVDRISGILKSYDALSIFTEFLQNAEDAGATKCVFKLDPNVYGTDSILSPRMAACQGPALIIYNDAEFTKDDLHALCRLGVGNKRKDPTKIGRHGQGFNSVFHLTDVPSVVSGTSIGYFDPLRAYLPEIRRPQGFVAQGGDLRDFQTLKGSTYADQMAPYKGHFGCDMENPFKGTIFRIPLRTPATTLANVESAFGDRAWTVERLKSILSNWREESRIAMLFLKNITTIEIQDDDYCSVTTKSDTTDGSALEEYTSPLASKDTTSARLINVEFELGSEHKDQEWLICHDSEFLQSTPKDLMDLAKKNRWIPDRGVAFPWPPLESTSKKIQGRVFSHLPMPLPLKTNTPFHLHASFALLSERKGLAGDVTSGATDDQARWNGELRSDMLPWLLIKSYAILLNLIIARFETAVSGKSDKDREETQKLYFGHLPSLDTLANIVDETVFWRRTYESAVFPCQGKDFSLVARSGCDAVFYGALENISYYLQQKIVILLIACEKPICQCPNDVLSSVNKARGSSDLDLCQEVTPALLREVLVTRPDFFSAELDTSRDRQQLLQFVFKDLHPKDEDDDISASVSVAHLPIVPLLNGQWGTPCSTTGVIYYTAKPKMRELLAGPSGLACIIDEDIFHSSDLKNILKVLVKNSKYCITDMDPVQFTAVFCKDHPNGTDNVLLDKIWSFLRDEEDLEPFGDLKIVKTVWSDIKPLKEVRSGLTLMENQIPPEDAPLSGLLRERGILVFPESSHHNHRNIITENGRYCPKNVLRCLSEKAGWERSYVFGREEAAILRNWFMTKDMIPDDAWDFLGRLKIWEPYISSPSASLTSANASYYQTSFPSDDVCLFGDFPSLIKTAGVPEQTLSSLGARDLDPKSALRDYILPKARLLSALTLEQKRAYGDILATIMLMGDEHTNADFLQATALIPTRTGLFVRFVRSFELFHPNDDLLTSLFGDEPEKFPDEIVWQRGLQSYSGSPIYQFKTSTEEHVVELCATKLMEKIESLPIEQRILSTTITAAGASPALYALAVKLVKHIYEQSRSHGSRWRNSGWRIIPAVLTTDPIQSQKVPLDRPTFQSFDELRTMSWIASTWTQCAYFPSELEPPSYFTTLHPKARGHATVSEIAHHLRVLVQDLAPIWTSDEQKLMLKASLITTYQQLEDCAADKNLTEELTTLLKTIMKNVPFILNGSHLDPSLSESWLRPDQLMLDIDYKLRFYQPVYPGLLVYRKFLVAAGVPKIEGVEGPQVEVQPGREVGTMERKMFEFFKDQDGTLGFMDTKFTLIRVDPRGNQIQSSILAHKFILAYASKFFENLFTKVWSKELQQDPENPLLTVVDMTRAVEGDVEYEAFWGVLYYLYTDKLIPTNGSQPAISSSPPSSSGTQNNDWLQQQYEMEGDRLQYLMSLLQAAHYYDVCRLKSLISQELIDSSSFTPRTSTSDADADADASLSSTRTTVKPLIDFPNVFEVRQYAQSTKTEDLETFCTTFIRNNSERIRPYLQEEIEQCELQGMHAPEHKLPRLMDCLRELGLHQVKEE
ncbi:hypothetical protein BGZ83_007240 [Gryganskiella cystojenkinii]|nr:hypothetical protein BGZ83_007240 [Gryganskiella cystojenkinii]